MKVLLAASIAAGVVATLAALAACASTSETLDASDGASEAGVEDARRGEGAAWVQPAANERPVPAMTGGAIAPGRYILTSSVEYFGAPIPPDMDPIRPQQAAIEIDGTEFRSHLKIARKDDGQSEETFIASYRSEGNEMTLGFSCPIVGQNKKQYATDGTTFAQAFPGFFLILLADPDGGALVDGGFYRYTTDIRPSIRTCAGDGLRPPSDDGRQEQRSVRIHQRFSSTELLGQPPACGSPPSCFAAASGIRAPAPPRDETGAAGLLRSRAPSTRPSDRGHLGPWRAPPPGAVAKAGGARHPPCGRRAKR
jgi:hypothetical protein